MKYAISKSKNLVLTVGVPASGKSTWAINENFDATISLDYCRQELWGNHTIQDGPGGVAALLVLQKEKIRQAMKESLNIVIHNTNHLQEYRQPLIALAHHEGYSVTIVYFDTTPDECRRRNRKRDKPVPDEIMDEFIHTIEEPTSDEGNQVIRFSQFSSLTEKMVP